jgi:hypothetical protein
MPDTHNKTNGPVKPTSMFLKKTGFVPKVLELSRTIKDDFVYDKADFDLYYLGMKAEQKNEEFGDKAKMLRVLS